MSNAAGSLSAGFAALQKRKDAEKMQKIKDAERAEILRLVEKNSNG
jgi:hypothetical protein